MMKQDHGKMDGTENYYFKPGNADQWIKKHPENKREQQLYAMKPYAGCGIHLFIFMMKGMKLPQERDHMIKAMPPVH